MNDKKEKKQQEKQKIDEFLKDYQNSQEKENQSSDNKPEKPEDQFQRKPYRCPSCHRFLTSRKEPCKYCGYKGYIPMSEEDTRKTRFILFIVLLAAAIVVYVLTHRAG